MKTYLALGVALLAGQASAMTNLVTNGSFETVAAGTPAAGFEIGANYIYGQAVTGWTSTNASPTESGSAFNVLFNGNTATTQNPDTRYTAAETQTLSSDHYPGPSPDGGNLVALDGDTNFNSYFEQTINGLTAGQTYDVSFDWAGTQFQNRGGATTIYLNVGFGGQSQSTPVYGGGTHYFEGWTPETFHFTADGTSDVLSFLAIGTPNGQPPVALLDGVSVIAAPEPGTWALMLIGVGAIGAAGRRRRLLAA